MRIPNAEQKEAPTGGRTPSRGTTEHPDKETINMHIISDTADITTAPISEADINVVDNDPEAPGTFLTAWKRNGTDWRVTVDYFEHHNRWVVGGWLKDDETGDLTNDKVLPFLDAYNAAANIAEYMNRAHNLTSLLDDMKALRTQLDELLHSDDSKGN